MNRDLVVAVANKVNDEDSVILWDILKKTRSEEWWNIDRTNTMYQLCLNMLEDVESEEE